MQTKVCAKCDVEKGLGEFYRQKTAKDGVQSWCKVCTKQYYKDNKESIKQYGKQYREDNKERAKHHSAKRRAKKLNATPDWLTPIDSLIMRHAYETCPEGHHVDHIVPLRGKTVSGLHVPWNLQHLPATENISKGNREWPDMWLTEEVA